MLRTEKERVVAELAKQLGESETLMVADYRGLTMPEIDELRGRLLEAGARFRVVKNTLTKLAAEQAGTTEEVAHEHQLVQGALDAVTSACAAWRQRPSAETGEALADSLVELNVVLQPHLDDEEQKVVPLAAVTLTQAEWDALGERARAAIPRNKMAVAFGMLLEPLDESDRAYMKGQLPAPVRLLYPFLIQRPWTKYASTLRAGT